MESVYILVSKTRFCGFESHLGYQYQEKIMPIDWSFVYRSDFMESEAGKEYWAERLKRENAERERIALIELENKKLKEQIATLEKNESL